MERERTTCNWLTGVNRTHVSSVTCHIGVFVFFNCFFPAPCCQKLACNPRPPLQATHQNLTGTLIPTVSLSTSEREPTHGFPSRIIPRPPKTSDDRMVYDFGRHDPATCDSKFNGQVTFASVRLDVVNCNKLTISLTFHSHLHHPAMCQCDSKKRLICDIGLHHPAKTISRTIHRPTHL